MASSTLETLEDHISAALRVARELELSTSTYLLSMALLDVCERYATSNGAPQKPETTQ